MTTKKTITQIKAETAQIMREIEMLEEKKKELGRHIFHILEEAKRPA